MNTLRLALLAIACTAANTFAQSLSDYQNVINSQVPSAWFQLNGALTDKVSPAIELGTYVSGTGGFADDASGNPNSSYFFSGQSDFLLYDANIYGTNLLSGGGESNITSTATGSISFLFRSLDPGTNTGQRFLFSAGNTTVNANALGLFVENNNEANGDPNSLKLRFGNATTTILPAASLVPNTWYYFALTYKEDRAPDTAKWYLGRLGGTLVAGETSNSEESVAGEGGSLAIGNHLGLTAGFRNPGSGRIDEFAIWRRELTAQEIQAQFNSLPQLPVPPPAENYQQVILSQTPRHYYKLDGTLTNSAPAGPDLTVNGTASGFSYDYFDNPGRAYFFSAGSDALRANENLLSGGGHADGTLGAGKGTLSCLIRMLSGTNNTGQRFVFSAGGSTVSSNGFGLFVENWSSGGAADFGSLKFRLGNASRPILWPTNFASSAWYFFAAVYDESAEDDQVTWYLGRPGHELQTGTLDYSYGSRAGQGNIFVIGNHTNFNARWGSPGNGQVDEFAIWHRKLTPEEITAQFNALVTAPPALSISIEGGNVRISWPVSAPGFVLESASTLTAPAWTSAGTPVIVGSSFVVQTPVGPGEKFYRLKRE